jgi:hypothetical protein
MFTNVPSEVIVNVSSYLIGKPEYVRLKRNKTLKAIQTKYKITRKIIEIGKLNGGNRYEYMITRQIPFSVGSIKTFLKVKRVTLKN